MRKKARPRPRREEALSRDQIVEASIKLLDRNGEGGLTFRALCAELDTGPGAIYWHIADKIELVAAACDAIVVRTLSQTETTTPEATVRAVGLAVFDVIDEHSWVGSAFTSATGMSPVLRIFERIGQQIRALEVPLNEQWSAAGTLMAYILGVSAQNAANKQLAKTRSLNRSDFLDSVSASWLQLDLNEYPFARRVAAHIRNHDDRIDFIAGIDLILKGICPSQQREKH